jgi:hypothetical protein
MTSNGSANEAPRGTRAKQLNNAETGGRNDIMTIILANGASYDFKERVVLRRLSLEMRVEVGKRLQGRERGRLIVEFGHKSGSEQKPNCSRMCQRSRPLHTFYDSSGATHACRSGKKCKVFQPLPGGLNQLRLRSHATPNAM